MQNSDISIIDVVDSLETTKRSYKQLHKKFRKNEKNVFEILATMKGIIVEENEDAEPIY